MNGARKALYKCQQAMQPCTVTITPSWLYVYIFFFHFYTSTEWCKMFWLIAPFWRHPPHSFTPGWEPVMWTCVRWPEALFALIRGGFDGRSGSGPGPSLVFHKHTLECYSCAFLPFFSSSPLPFQPAPPHRSPSYTENVFTHGLPLPSQLFL